MMRSLLEFVYRGRPYFFILILTLVALMGTKPINHPPTHEASVMVQKLEGASKTWDTLPSPIAKWTQAFDAHPLAVATLGTIMGFFIIFFLGGLILLGKLREHLNFQAWFRKNSQSLKPLNSGGVLFFRVLILTFAGVVILGRLLGMVFDAYPQGENALSILHALLIDGIAVLSVFAVLGKTKINFNLNGSLNIQWAEIQRGVAAYAAVFPIFVLSLVLVSAVSSWLHYEPPIHPLVKIFLEEEKNSRLIFNLTLFLAAIGAPIFEEIFFRGFCYPALQSFSGKTFAAFATAAFFAGLHGSGFAFIPIFILGLALVQLYEIRGSLVACWTFHILHNILFTTYFFAAKTILGS